MTNVDEVERYFEVGRAEVLQSKRIQGEEGRVRTFIRGWQRGAYVLLDVPRAAAGKVALRERDRCVLRFLADGNACGCNAEMEDLETGSHFSYVTVSWPESVLCSREEIRARPCEYCLFHVP